MGANRYTLASMNKCCEHEEANKNGLALAPIAEDVLDGLRFPRAPIFACRAAGGFQKPKRAQP
jgi:hypothetical protein